ncbi:ThuA domain-containing protein [Bryobacter aggregatus]|uniref:ThuA domain-containing protein n=1 Tax=Bryobacter aggregatus TaxID=360054 RepID=UPI000B27EFBF|nr:ThuA domain-containing protein [Bryobacter aggregatus]
MFVVLFLAAISMMSADRELLLFAGTPSHPAGQHEHNAGVLLLQKALARVPGLHTTVALNGVWPAPAVIEKADGIFFFADGAEGHPIFKSEEHVAEIRRAVARGVGLMFYHYAIEPPAAKGHQEMLDWISGYFELNHSVNPHWDATFQSLPKHPITQGVKPFTIRDEWYFNMRVPKTLQNATPILVATPPKEVFSEKDGPRLGNPDVRAKVGQPQVVAWAVERPDGGRGVGWTGGHFHKNLGDDNFRKLVLNALLWISKVEVPAGGVLSSVSAADLAENWDKKN